MGLGKSGEAYLVAQNGTLITELRPMHENSKDFIAQIGKHHSKENSQPQIAQVERTQTASGWLTIAKSEASKGQAGMGETRDYVWRMSSASYTGFMASALYHGGGTPLGFRRPSV